MIDLSLAFVHADAAVQPTAIGRRIAVIQDFAGQLFFGYGDWNANTGPVRISAYDLSSDVLADEYVMSTEQVAVFRVISDRLYAAAIDPGRGYEALAWRDLGGTWHSITNVGFDHVFDIQSRCGSEVWAIGSLGADAIVRYSPDGGETWESERALDVAPSRQANGFARFYFGGVLNNQLFVQADAAKKGHVFRAGQWEQSPALLGNPAFGSRCVTFRGQLVYLATVVSMGHAAVWQFDGQQKRELKKLPWAADLQVVGVKLYFLTSSGLGVTSDLTDWFEQPFSGLEAGEEPTAFRIVGDKVYVGTNQSRVLVGRL